MAATIGVRIEREFQKIAQAVCLELTPEHLEVLAAHQVRLADYLGNRAVPKPSAVWQIGIDYINALPEARVIEVLEEVLPEHVAVLRRYPAFANQLTQELKNLLTER